MCVDFNSSQYFTIETMLCIFVSHTSNLLTAAVINSLALSVFKLRLRSFCLDAIVAPIYRISIRPSYSLVNVLLSSSLFMPIFFCVFPLQYVGINKLFTYLVNQFLRHQLQTLKCPPCIIKLSPPRDDRRHEKKFWNKRWRPCNGKEFRHWGLT